MGMGIQAGFNVWRGRLISKEDVRRIPIKAREEKDPLPALRNESKRIDHAIGPLVPPTLKLTHQAGHGLAAIEMEHKGHIFEQNPFRFPTVKKPKNMVNQTRASASYACGFSGLTEILAGKPRRKKLNALGQSFDLSDIAEI